MNRFESTNLFERGTMLAERAQRQTKKVSERFSSPVHDRWVASLLGVTLGVAFTVAFLTGLVDYLSQHDFHGYHLPRYPLNLYRISQGTHVITGIATIPLLASKLWTVWPKLFEWPPIRSVVHAIERLSLVALVGGSLFLLFSGVLNIDYWYSPMPYFFPTAHFWAAWIMIGGLIVHIGAKGAIARDAIVGHHRQRRAGAVAHADAPKLQATPERGGFTRRGFLATSFTASGVLVATTIGETVAPLRSFALLAPRNPTVGPEAVPVNQTAVQAQVTTTATDPGYRLMVTGNCRRPSSFSLADLQVMPQRSAGLPIACVEGWSAAAQWRGVSLPHLLDLVGAPASAQVRVESLESQNRLYSSSVVDASHARHPDTLLALELNGGPLDLDHGYPLRLIAPDRPGVLQTKWLSRIVVL